MDNPHKDQVVIITGGAGGIGSQMASTFANQGARVVIAGRDQDKLTKAATHIAGKNSICLHGMVGLNALIEAFKEMPQLSAIKCAPAYASNSAHVC